MNMNIIKPCVPFKALDNAVVESNRSFKVLLESNDAAVTITTQLAVVHIQDDDSKFLPHE